MQNKIRCFNQILYITVLCAPVILSFLIPYDDIHDVEKKSIINKLHDIHYKNRINFEKHRHRLHMRKNRESWKKKIFFYFTESSYFGLDSKEGQFLIVVHIVTSIRTLRKKCAKRGPLGVLFLCIRKTGPLGLLFRYPIL